MKRIVIFLILFIFFAYQSSAQEIRLSYDVENRCSDCPEPPLPSINELKEIKSLPDPFMWSDTTRGRIKTIQDWRYRRAEIGVEIQHYETGRKPAPPDTLLAEFKNNTLRVTVIENGDTLVLTAPITLPEGEGPFPAVIGVGSFGGTGSLPSDIFTSRNIATIQYNFSELAPWGFDVKRGTGGFYKLFPDPKIGFFTAWAWGVSRIIDGLKKIPDLKIDLSRLAITGCSFAGKIALFSAAFDERIALTISQESGGGGYTAWRVTETLSGSRETLRNAQGAPWYLQSLSQFNNYVTKLPYDHHELMAMIAPRALLVTGNPDYEWLADESGHVASLAAHEVWKALGVPDRFGFSIVGGHQHCIVPASQIPEIEAFVDKFLLGDTTANTNIQTTPYNTDLSRWITWDTPELKDVPTSVGKADQLIDDFKLFQNYPNPFNPETKIVYKVPVRSFVSLKIYNSLGQEIKTLFEGFQNQGKYEIVFDAADLASGIYFYKLEAGKNTNVKKLMLLK